ncbi:hypothetical protein [Dactylosporangium sp. NPDC050588]|uniref:hypothetical protein n=1 Tax=Dactylosporangium sp. NPDC050588 TaxID=3157211 RepID=UPI0033D3753B
MDSTQPDADAVPDDCQHNLDVDQPSGEVNDGQTTVDGRGEPPVDFRIAKCGLPSSARTKLLSR